MFLIILAGNRLLRKHFRVDVLNKDKLVSIAVPAERNRYDQV